MAPRRRLAGADLHVSVWIVVVVFLAAFLLAVLLPPVRVNVMGLRFATIGATASSRLGGLAATQLGTSTDGKSGVERANPSFAAALPPATRLASSPPPLPASTLSSMLMTALPVPSAIVTGYPQSMSSKSEAQTHSGTPSPPSPSPRVTRAASDDVLALPWRTSVAAGRTLVVVVALGSGQPHMDTAIAAAGLHNPVVIITESVTVEGPYAPEWPNVVMVPAASYHARLPAFDAVFDIHDHDIYYEFTRACFRRHLLVAELLAREGVQSVLHIDGDVQLFLDVSTPGAVPPDTSLLLTQSDICPQDVWQKCDASPHTLYATQERYEDFVAFLLAMFTDARYRATLQSKKSFQSYSFLSDMTLFFLYSVSCEASRRGEKRVDMADVALVPCGMALGTRIGGTTAEHAGATFDFIAGYELPGQPVLWPSEASAAATVGPPAWPLLPRVGGLALKSFHFQGPHKGQMPEVWCAYLRSVVPPHGVPLRWFGPHQVARLQSWTGQGGRYASCGAGASAAPPVTPSSAAPPVAPSSAAPPVAPSSAATPQVTQAVTLEPPAVSSPQSSSSMAGLSAEPTTASTAPLLVVQPTSAAAECPLPPVEFPASPSELAALLWPPSSPTPPAWSGVFSGSYPLTSIDLSRSWTPPAPPSACAFQRVWAALDAGESVNIAVVGGSVTFGSECLCPKCAGSEEEQKACAWPSRLQPWLLAMHPEWNVSVTNTARMAMSYGAWAQSATDPPFSSGIIILDASVNSQGLSPQEIVAGMQAYLTRLVAGRRTAGASTTYALAVLVVEEFRTCHDDHADCTKHCAGQPRGTTSDGRIGFCTSWWQIAESEMGVAREWGLPIASYRDAVWPVVSSPPENLGLLWNGMSHPDRAGHDLISDVVKHALIRLGVAEQPGSRSSIIGTVVAGAAVAEGASGAGVAAHSFCSTRPLSTTFGVDDAQHFQPSARTGSWRYYEDVPHKPGWVGADNDTTISSISFQVRFPVALSSRGPRLEMVYLRTDGPYTNATLRINECPGSAIRLDGHWQDRYSLPYTLVLEGTAHTAAAAEEAVLPHTRREGWPSSCEVPAPGETRTLTFDVAPASPRRPNEPEAGTRRFKVMSISAC